MEFLDPLQWFYSCSSPGQFLPAETTWWAFAKGTLYMLAKEYVAVLVQLVCYSRVMLPDMFTGPLILFMMLVVFGFPFLSSYLFFVLRLGPWYNGQMGVRGWMRIVLQAFLMTSAQLLGALTAASFLNTNGHIWAQSGMTESGSSVYWLFANVDDKVDPQLPALEEALNTLLFMMGLLHLMEADTELMTSAFWSKAQNPDLPEKKTEVQEDSNTAFRKEVGAKLDTLTATIQALKARLEDPLTKPVPPPFRLEPLPRNLSGSYLPLGETRRKNPDGANFTFHVPIPITFIAHVCVLLAATTRAFPTAHGTPAITLFLAQMGYCDQSVAWSRVAGGCIGALVALFYYYAIYVWPGRNQRGVSETFVQTVVVAPPAFLYSELQLPHGMKQT